MIEHVELDLRMNRARRDAAMIMQVLGDLCDDKGFARDLLVTSFYTSDVSIRPNDDLPTPATPGRLALVSHNGHRP